MTLLKKLTAEDAEGTETKDTRENLCVLRALRGEKDLFSADSLIGKKMITSYCSPGVVRSRVRVRVWTSTRSVSGVA
jgi:hypothetical protein